MADFKTSVVLFDPSNMSAFGSLEIVDITPVLQGDFVYGLNTQLWSSGSVSGSGAAVDTNASRLRIQGGTNATGFSFITSRRSIRYRAGQGTLARFTPLFTAGVANNIQLWGIGSISSNAPYDGYFFGYNGISFGIAHYNSGTPTWYTQTSDWNGDKVDGSAGTSFTWDKTKGVPVMIKYPFLGYGDIEFFVQNPTTGRWVLVHTIAYANSSTSVQVSNPTLQFIGFTKNSGNTTNQIMYCASVGVFISGMRSFVGNPKWAIDNNKSTITTETNILTLRNATTYNGVTNRGLIRLNSISFGGDAGKNTVASATMRLKVNASLGGSPSYTAINGTTADGGVTITSGNSIASYDTAGTTVTGGTHIYNLTVSEPGSTWIDLTPFDIFVAPGETMTFSGFSSSSATITIAVNWTEDI
jgi:hypothetical protein